VRDPRLTGELDDMFDSLLDPSTRCWVMESDGSWTASPASGERVRDHQVQMMRQHHAAE
jgi:polyphosphate kinase